MRALQHIGRGLLFLAAIFGLPFIGSIVEGVMR